MGGIAWCNYVVKRRVDSRWSVVVLTSVCLSVCLPGFYHRSQPTFHLSKVWAIMPTFLRYELTIKNTTKTVGCYVLPNRLQWGSDLNGVPISLGLVYRSACDRNGLVIISSSRDHVSPSRFRARSWTWALGHFSSSDTIDRPIHPCSLWRYNPAWGNPVQLYYYLDS